MDVGLINKQNGLKLTSLNSTPNSKQSPTMLQQYT